MNRKEKIEDAIKRARDIADAAGDNPTAEQTAELKKALDFVEVERKKFDDAKAFEADLNRLSGFSIGEKSDEQVPMAKTLGEHFVKAAGDTLKRQAAGARLEASTPDFKMPEMPMIPTGELRDSFGTTYSRSIVNQRRERLVAADLMGAASVTLPTIKYLVEKLNRMVEGAPRSVEPGGHKPYVRFDTFDIVTESLSKIAALTKLSDEMVEDYGFVADWVNSQLIYELSVVEEQQLLRGDGAGANLRGLLNREGIQTHDASGDAFDGLFEAIQKIPLATNLTADGLVINPADYQSLRLAKDANRQYLGGGPFQGQYGVGGVLVEPPVWGLRTIVTQAVPVGTAIVGAFRQGATVLRKGGLRVDSTNTNVDDFEHNLVTLRAEQRLGLMVPLPAAFVEVSLAGSTVPTPVEGA